MMAGVPETLDALEERIEDLERRATASERRWEQLVQLMRDRRQIAQDDLHGPWDERKLG